MESAAVARVTGKHRDVAHECLASNLVEVYSYFCHWSDAIEMRGRSGADNRILLDAGSLYKSLNIQELAAMNTFKLSVLRHWQHS